MVDIEVDMREELRDMLKEEQSPTAIENFVNNILVKLSTAEQLLIIILLLARIKQVLLLLQSYHL